MDAPDLRFFERDPLIVSRELIGTELYSDLSGAACGGIIVETEAYIGPNDRASHAWKGRRTPRTEVQFGARGRAYVYQIYGIHKCFNVVVGPEGCPAVVLIRALRPSIGLETMACNRGFKDVPDDLSLLTSGPGRLTQALGINMGSYGADISSGSLCIRGSEYGRRLVRECGISATRRINIDYAGEWAKKSWRFVLNNENCVSR